MLNAEVSIHTFLAGFQLCTRFSQKENRRRKLQANITFDRCSITSCSCTCEARSPWCSHVVAACLARVRYPLRTEIRTSLSGSLFHLDRTQLQKFAQYLIARASGDLLFDAQELLDEFHIPESDVNIQSGAPGTLSDHTVVISVLMYLFISLPILTITVHCIPMHCHIYILYTYRCYWRRSY